MSDTILRFKWDNRGGVDYCPNGSYVLFSDHERELAAKDATIENLRIENQKYLNAFTSAEKDFQKSRATIERLREALEGILQVRWRDHKLNYFEAFAMRGALARQALADTQTL